MKKMKNLFVLFLSCSSLLTTAQLRQQESMAGVPCKTCSTASRNGPNSVENGNQALSTSYTASACGLNYMQASVRLGQRGSIAGVVQPAPITVSGLPSCYTIVKAFLYADASGNGIAINASLTNPASTASVFPMTMIGSGPDKCWGYAGSYSYRADVTALITGNGTYTLSGLPTGNPNDVDGATILIIYRDLSQSYTGNLIIADGAHETNGGLVTDVLTGFSACANSTFAQGFMIISDLGQVANTSIQLNSSTPNYTEPFANDNYWNFIQGSAPQVISGQTTATFGANNASDCFNEVLAGLYYRTSCSTCSPSAPAVTVSSSASLICTGQTATLTASGASTYTWSTGANTPVIAVSPTTSVTYTVIGSGSGCSDTTTFSQSVSACTGVIDLKNDKAIDLFPNPNNGEFTLILNSTNNNRTIEVYNSSGHIISRIPASEGAININIHKEPQGLYYIRVIEDNKAVLEKKIIKN